MSIPGASLPSGVPDDSWALVKKLRKLDVRQTFWTVFGFSVLLGAFASVVWLIALAIREGATVLAAILAALATVAAAMVARYFERKKDLEAVRREYLGPIYENLAGLLAGQTMTERKTAKVAGEPEDPQGVSRMAGGTVWKSPNASI